VCGVCLGVSVFGSVDDSARCETWDGRVGYFRFSEVPSDDVLEA